MRKSKTGIFLFAALLLFAWNMGADTKKNTSNNKNKTKSQQNQKAKPAPAAKPAAAPAAKPATAPAAKPATAPAPSKTEKPDKKKILSRLMQEQPFRQTKVGENTSFPLLSGAVVNGKVYKMTEKGVWIDDGVAKLLQRRSGMSMEGRSKFYKADYDKYINDLADDEVRSLSGITFKGNEKSVVKPGDPRFEKPKKKSSAGIGVGSSTISLK